MANKFLLFCYVWINLLSNETKVFFSEKLARISVIFMWPNTDYKYTLNTPFSIFIQHGKDYKSLYKKHGSIR